MPVSTILPVEVQKLIAGGQTVDILDVRTPVEFAGVHAAGAHSQPLDRLDPAAVARARSGRAEPLYIICQSGARAAKACEKLQAAGVQVLSIEGGTAAWERAGLPVERSSRKIMSLERQVRVAAGSLVLTGAILAWTVHPYFLGLSAFVGAGLVFAGLTDTCGMGMLLARMPWNRTAPACHP